jgi:hypothetical protein
MQYYLQMYKKQHTPQGIEAVRALVKANAWSLLLRGCTSVHCLRQEFVCVCGVCLCWIQGVAFVLRSRGSCIRHGWCAMSSCVGSFAGFPELTMPYMVFGSGFPHKLDHFPSSILQRQSSCRSRSKRIINKAYRFLKKER